MNHFINDSATPEWLVMSASLLTDDGHTLEFRDGRVIVDGVASVDSYRSARELITA